MKEKGEGKHGQATPTGATFHGKPSRGVMVTCDGY